MRINKLKFDVNQKEEAIKFKDKSLRIANQDIKKLRESVIELKENINVYEEKNISLQSQIRGKNDIIKRLERKVQAFINTKSIAVKLETNSLNNNEDKHILRNKGLLSDRGQIKFKLKRKTEVQKLTGMNFDSLLAMTINQAKHFENSSQHSLEGNSRFSAGKYNNSTKL